MSKKRKGGQTGFNMSSRKYPKRDGSINSKPYKAIRKAFRSIGGYRK